MSESFLPPNYELPNSGSHYFKPQKGDNRIRILAAPVLGFVHWIEEDGKRKPIRTPMGQPVSTSLEPRHFWAMPVLDYAEKSVKVWEITQVSLQKSLRELSKDKEWGSPTGYDISVNRSGDGMETEYSVIPKPKKETGPETKRLWQSALDDGFNLEAIFEGGDPFNWDTGTIAIGDEDHADEARIPRTVDPSEPIKIEDIPF